MKIKSVFITAIFLLFATFTFASNADKTVANIKAAIKGETTASAKYAAYAKKAEEEGYQKIALLFNAASKAESIHAGNHRSILNQLGMQMDDFTPEFTVKSTKENLKDAINGESYEVATMYPNFIKAAKEDNINLAQISFNYAYQTEKKHKRYYEKALKQLEENKESTLPSKYYVCTTCGNTYETEAPDRCGISMTPKERFVTIQ